MRNDIQIYKSVSAQISLRVLILSIVLLAGFMKTALAQMTISGPTCAAAGQTYTYSVSSSYTSGNPTQWEIIGGLIAGTSSSSQNGTGLSSVSVIWNSGSGSVNVHVYSSGNYSASLNVSATAILSPGVINGNSAQTVYKTTPGTISCSAASNGGCPPITYSYQWQQSTDQSTWTNVPGATGQNLSFSGALSANTYYYRRYVLTNAQQSGYSGIAVVNVLAALNGGNASPASQSVLTGAAPAVLSCSMASGGNCNGSYGYQWVNSSNGSTFYPISGATGSSYTPPALTQTMYYQRMVTCGGESVYSTTATVNVYPHLAPGTISSAGSNVNYGESPGTISTTSATGGTCGGNYTYRWQVSTDGNVSFTDISGATGQSYTPGNLTATTGYRCKISCETETVYTGNYTATVYPQLMPGSITTTPQTINYGADAATLASVGTASGGDGAYDYVWQSSPDNATWTNIITATGLTYKPTQLLSTTYFRRSVNSNDAIVYTNSVKITVYPQLLAGTISPASQSINYSTAAAPIASSASGSGGNGTITYLWQISDDGSSWTDISPAVTSNGYAPGTLYATTYFRRVAISNGARAYTAAAIVTVINNQPMAITPSSNMNYIVNSTLRTEVDDVTGITQLSGMNVGSVDVNIQYFDGLGRPIQSVDVKGSKMYKDVVQPIEYDEFGREVKKYLPYALKTGTSNGSYKTDALSSGLGQPNFYSTPISGIPNIPNPYAQTVYESSPLNRVLEQGAPGAAWQPLNAGISTSGHTVKQVYATNNEIAFSGADTVTSRIVPLYMATANPNGSRTLTRGNATDLNYKTGELYVTVSKDENWTNGRGGTTEEYKDKEGHVVLKRTFNYTGAPLTLQMLSTYYVYDDSGNLAYVLTPGSNADVVTPTGAILNNLCYWYRYDERNRLTQKKIPGKGWEFTVYNQLDQPVLTQDSTQRLANQWTVNKYDAFGRVVITGLWNAGSVRTLANLQASIYGGTQADVRDNTITTGITPGYHPTSYPTLSKTLQINYYDDYLFPAKPFNPAVTGTLTNPTGLLTASRTMVLNTVNNSAPDMMWAVHYYDDKGRQRQTTERHYLGGILSASNYDVETVRYNFNNQITRTQRRHFTSSSATVPFVTVNDQYIYDHMGRKIKTWKQITNGDQAADTRTLISQLDYNEVGQLWKKHLHSTDSVNFRQDITYAYNERGWLRTSSAPLFAEELRYNTGVTKFYNGNIAYQFWGVPGNLDKHYTYLYDQLNRLTLGNSTISSGTLANNENSITYDNMGSITAMKRFAGAVLIDQLTYTYGTNSIRLASVNDATTNDLGLKQGTTTYAYDGNGNLTQDSGKGITGISYNLLNLPQTITGKNTTYTYDATGQKLRRVLGTDITDYINGIQYDNSSGSTAIAFIQTEEGRALPKDASTYNYEYTLTDHLGNSRVSFDSFGATATAKQTDDYYPFGMDIKSATIPSLKNNYLYNKKELQENLGWYDYGARFYDPVIARWTSIDPLAEAYRKSTPYNYAANSPVKNIDPNGMAYASTIINPGGTVIDHTDDDDHGVYMDFGDGTKALVGYEDPDKKYKKGDQYTFYDPTKAKNYGGQYLIPASAYNYNQGDMPDKQSQDLEFILNGTDGGDEGVINRWWQILVRDINAPGNQSNVQECDDVATVLLGILGVASPGKLIGTTRSNLLNSAQNSKLRRLIEYTYREGAQVGDGSTMAAYRLEQASGVAVGGRNHTQKIFELRTALTKVWRNRANLSAADRQIVKSMLIQVQHAISGQ